MSESQHHGRFRTVRDLFRESLQRMAQDILEHRFDGRPPAESLRLPLWLLEEEPESLAADDPLPNDPVLHAFLERQRQAGLQLAAESDILELQPLDNFAGPPHRYQARYHCTSALRQPDGRIVPAKAVFDAAHCLSARLPERVHPLASWRCSGP